MADVAMGAAEAAAARKREVKTADKQKKNPVGEFLFYYLGTIALLLTLDHFGVLYPGRNALALMPPLERMFLPNIFAEATRDHAYFVGLGVLLTAPMHLWRQFVRNRFRWLATRFAGLHPSTSKYDKFLEQGWLAVHYSIVSALEVYTILVCQAEAWPPMMTEEARLAVLPPLAQAKEHHEQPLVRAVYLLQYTFYFMELLTLVLDSKSRSRSDAFVYALHHLLTVFLISLSWVYEAQNIGFLVLLFHDVGDIFLPIAKCFVYAEDYSRVHRSRRVFKLLEALGVFFFICFLVAFGFFRLVLFPTLIYTGVYEAAWMARDWDPARDGPTLKHQPVEEWTTTLDYHTTYARPILVIMLVLLLPLHVYWFRLALRVAYRAVMGIYDDERSDNEDGDDDDKKND